MPKDVLKHVMPPPPHPFQSSGDWHAVEVRQGLALPGDYKQFITDYGCGTIGRFLSVFNPHCLHPHINLLTAASECLNTLRVLQAGGETMPYPFYPEEGGVLPVGGTDNGDTVFWLTQGMPDQWEIVVNESRGPLWERFPGGLTDFLVGVLTGTIRCSVFPASFPGSDTSFRPFDGNVQP